MANKTVYPYGTQGSLPASIGVINDCKTGGADKALAAQQGVYLDGKINKVFGGLTTEVVDLDNYTQVNYYIDSSDKWSQADGSTGHKQKCVFIPLDNVMNVSLVADGGSALFAFLKSTARSDGGTPDFSTTYQGRIVLSDGESGDYVVPTDASYLYVMTMISDGTSIKSRYDDFEFSVFRFSVMHKEDFYKEIFPKCHYYPLSTSSGDQATTYRGTGVYTTSRFIAVIGKTIGITLGAQRYCKVYEYGNGFSFIQSSSEITIAADTRTEFTLSDSTKFIKLVFFYDYPDATGNAKTTVKVDGEFPEKWDVFNPRPSDSGYMKVMVAVRVTDPTSCDDEGSTVQDASQILPDYGVICLPTQYTPTGKPTRLIIYCHGAAVNYSSSVSRFDSQDLDPTYWLAEGYAVMDIEGNPFNNSDEHMQTPQAMDCYVAAYEWAIEYFNLRRDGILLGGRSMGGGMVFGIVRSQCPIPVIAACPNVPSAMCIGSSSNDRQQFFATHCGFDIPSGFNWSSNYINGNIETAGSKKKLFYDNWDKLVKNVPIWCMATDLPIDEDNKKALVSNLYVESTDRKTLWGKLHIMARCPIKLFGCNQDTTCPIPETSGLYYRMLTNAGQIAELRIFNSYKDYSGTGTSAHHYDTQDPALRANITTSYGEALTNVPIVYIEMLAFWRRYEQGL